jgi:hypothetical protein
MQRPDNLSVIRMDRDLTTSQLLEGQRLKNLSIFLEDRDLAIS